MKNLALNAPAKLNLSLRVLGKRDDGFHEIDTLMVKLPNLADQITFQESDVFSFACDDAEIPTDESNLVVKAVKAFESATGFKCGYSISLKKSIPHGAGLGGGSSDAATTLQGLNQLHGHPIAVEPLMNLAATLGSDIPFFIASGAAKCTGRGATIIQVSSPPPLRVLLLKPSFSVTTPDAYGRWQYSHQLTGIPYEPQSVDGIEFVNDLERPVFQKHRFLAELKLWLLARRETAAALMSGSGSTVFAVLKENTDDAELVKAARFEMDPGLWSWSGTTEI
jgi:4-diphosphocytidyl-2-C-methyl-D-erythritol kinase